jgi:RHH-type proline utilization regulon transcriptional repressor/proline dehydrogenase/delta 1-pyrroline-5-carboxylate dehydrogenase
VTEVLAEDVPTIARNSSEAAAAWAAVLPSDRAACLERAAALMEERIETLMGIDHARGGQVRGQCGGRSARGGGLPALLCRTGAQDAWPFAPAAGPVVCISPWNFPLAIFTGQVAAALVAGNTVMAKPAEADPDHRA